MTETKKSPEVAEKEERQWTPDQKKALEARNTSLVVSAAAGSGKTSVLTERICRLLSDRKNPVRASRLAVVTYTVNAAREVAGRLFDALSKKIAEGGEDADYLSQQLIALSRAQISTVHSFCYSIIRDHRKKLGLPEKIRISDDDKVKELRSDAIDEAVEDFFQTETEENAEQREALFRLFSDAKSGTLLAECIDKILSDVSAYPGGTKRLADNLENMKKDVAAMKKGDFGFAETRWGQILCENAEKRLSGSAAVLTELADSLHPTDDKAAKSRDDLYVRADGLRRVALLLRLGRFSEAEAETAAVFKPTRPWSTTFSPEEEELVKSAYKKEKSALSAFFEKSLPLLEDEIPGESEEMLALLEELVFLVKDAERRFAEKKMARGLLDYGDLEKFALQLVGEEKDGKWQQSELGRSLAEEFDAVFVDEYQDTNELQDCIFRFLSKKDNLFVVGDPKQSIYRFRGAVPHVFTERTQATPLYPTEGESNQKILLSANFRCAENVVDFVNTVFRSLMRAEESTSLYKKEDELVFSKEKNDEEKKRLTELVFVEKPPREEETEDGDEAGKGLPEDGDEDDGLPMDEQLELGYVCQRIASMLSSEKKADGTPYVPEDIAVICETHSQIANVQNALKARDVPCAVTSAEAKKNSPEALFVRSLLSALDNPADDVALLGTLISPVFRFSPDEAYRIRLAKKKCSFFAAMKKVASDPSDSLREKVGDTLRLLEELRRDADRNSFSVFCFRIYRRLAIDAMFATSEGSSYREEVLRLAAEADGMELNTLGEFCRFLNNYKEKNSIEGDGVRVITIHQSKGLEFPVVFVIFLDRYFNTDDEKRTVLIDEGRDLASYVLRLGGIAKWNTAYRKALSFSLREKSLEEQIRKYYVALTRAKEKLILTAKGRKRVNVQSELLLPSQNPLSPQVRNHLIAQASTPIKLLLIALREEKPLQEYLATGQKAANGSFSVESVIAPPFEAFQGTKKAESAPPIPLEDCLDAFRFRYEEKEAETLPRKLSVSELCRTGREEEAGVFMLPLTASRLRRTAGAADIGTATHKVMQFISFAEAAVDVEKAIDTLRDKRFLSPEELALVDRDKIRGFFASPVFREMHASPCCEHEKRFNVLLPAMPLVGSEGEVLVQGVVDVWFEDPDGTLCLLDFKTDRVKPENGTEVLRERHGKQLRLYRRAVEEMTGKTVSRLLLYSFALNGTVSVPLEGDMV